MQCYKWVKISTRNYLRLLHYITPNTELLNYKEHETKSEYLDLEIAIGTLWRDGDKKELREESISSDTRLKIPNQKDDNGWKAI